MDALSVLSWIPEGESLKFPGVLSVCGSFLSGTPLSWKFWMLWSLWNLSSFSSTQGICKVLLGFPFPVLWPGSSLKATSWDSYRAYFTCFSSGILPLLHDIQYLKTTVSYILTVFLVVWVSMVNLIFVTPVIIYIIIIFKLNFALPQWRN